MATVEPKEITLATLGGGASEELWREAYKKVVENLQDLNTTSKGKREILLRFTFTQDEERHTGDVEITCVTKLAGIKGFSVPIFYGKRFGIAVAVAGPTQDEMFQNKDAKPRLVETGQGGDA